MTLDAWAARWNIPPAALAALRIQLGAGTTMPTIEPTGAEGSEMRQQSLIRIDAARKGVWLTRNNVGALIDKRGVPVRYGLANESKEQNRQVKSSDLIGIRPVLITPQHVGKTLGQFVAREIKHAGWKWRGDEHEKAQLNFINFVVAKGGDAAFASAPGTFDNPP